MLPAAGGNLRNHLQREDPPVAEPSSSHRHPGHSGSLVSDTGFFGTPPRNMPINRWVPIVLCRKGSFRVASPLNDVMETVDRDKTLHAWQQPMETWVAWR